MDTFVGADGERNDVEPVIIEDADGGERPFSCPRCGRRYKRKNNAGEFILLKRNLSQQTDVICLQLPICDTSAESSRPSLAPSALTCSLNAATSRNTFDASIRTTSRTIRNTRNRGRPATTAIESFASYLRWLWFKFIMFWSLLPPQFFSPPPLSKFMFFSVDYVPVDKEERNSARRGCHQSLERRN